MKMIDANVILRYLLRDIEEQYIIAKGIIEEGVCTIPEVIPELVYVLSGIYEVKREDVALGIKAVLEDVVVMDKSIIEAALDIYSSNSLDYVDCLFIARNRLLKETVFTFDNRLRRQLKEITNRQ